MRSTIVNPILTGTSSTIAPLFANLKTSTAKQLFQVAKMIEARDQTGAGRQIFFVQLGSFDTHGDQLNRQQNLFAELSPALKAFYDATVALGVASEVTQARVKEALKAGAETYEGELELDFLTRLSR